MAFLGNLVFLDYRGPMGEVESWVKRASLGCQDFGDRLD